MTPCLISLQSLQVPHPKQCPDYGCLFYPKISLDNLWWILNLQFFPGNFIAITRKKKRSRFEIKIMCCPVIFAFFDFAMVVRNGRALQNGMSIRRLKWKGNRSVKVWHFWRILELETWMENISASELAIWILYLQQAGKETKLLTKYLIGYAL